MRYLALGFFEAILKVKCYVKSYVVSVCVCVCVIIIPGYCTHVKSIWASVQVKTNLSRSQAT